MVALENRLNDEYFELEGKAGLLENSLRHFNEELEKYL